ncbi:MAG: hypothetical protein C9356_14150 [Oleiphilus sp.]|nr:MAG: hypothetical protein C9356_14150 [Oleiphilus sp.]
MTDKEREELKSIILQRIEFLLVLIDSNACGNAHPVLDNQVPVNMFDAGTRGPKSSVIDQSEIELTQLTRTLTWLESAHVGLCERCKQAVSFERMKSNPVSRLCDTCTEQQLGDLND